MKRFINHFSVSRTDIRDATLEWRNKLNSGKTSGKNKKGRQVCKLKRRDEDAIILRRKTTKK